MFKKANSIFFAMFMAIAATLSACGGDGGDGDTHVIQSESSKDEQTERSESSWSGADAAGGDDMSYSVRVKLQPSDLDYPNPERGFFKFAGYDPFLNLDRLRKETLDDLSNQGYRMVFVLGHLGNYRLRDLDGNYLDTISANFDLLRQAGLKAILRFSYNWGIYADTDASLHQVQRHIAQLAPILQQNEDVIAIVQAGFIGQWGEWHSSTNGLDDPSSQKQILDALLAAVPSSRQVQVRTPYTLWHDYSAMPTIADLSASPRPLSTRLGIHNDCFLSSYNDWGTYPERGDISSDELRTYTHDISAITSFGAETCLPEQGARLDCDDIMREGKYYYAAYLNESYYEENIDRWRRQGCFADVKKQLGYRLMLKEVAFNVPVDGDRSLAWKVTLTNDGWARPMNSRPLVFRLQDDRTNTTVNVPLNDSDLRLATPGETMTISGTMAMPDELTQGQYKILLGAPDPASSLAKDARYSIRFANSDWPDEHQRWLPDQGFMDLGVEFILD